MGEFILRLLTDCSTTHSSTELVPFPNQRLNSCFFVVRLGQRVRESCISLGVRDNWFGGVRYFRRRPITS